MIEFELSALWVTPSGRRCRIDERFVATLRAIETHGTLSAAAKALGVSYRTLWSLVQQFNAEFEAELIETSKGSGASVSAKGHQILWMLSHGHTRLDREFESESRRLNAQWLAPRSEQSALSMALSDDPLLPDLLKKEFRSWPLELEWKGSIAALSAFHRGEVSVAGCHLPVKSPVQTEVHTLMGRWLRGDDLLVLPLFEREMGWISRRGAQQPSLEDVAAGRARLINRDPSSSTHHQLLALVTRACLNPEHLAGFNDHEDSHLGLACSIGAGLADLGLGVRQAATRFDLEFRTVGWDRYFLVFRNQSPEAKQLAEFLKTLSKLIESELQASPEGYRPLKGDVMQLTHFLQEI